LGNPRFQLHHLESRLKCGSRKCQVQKINTKNGESLVFRMTNLMSIIEFATRFIVKINSSLSSMNGAVAHTKSYLCECFLHKNELFDDNEHFPSSELVPSLA